MVTIPIGILLSSKEFRDEGITLVDACKNVDLGSNTHSQKRELCKIMQLAKAGYERCKQGVLTAGLRGLVPARPCPPFACGVPCGEFNGLPGLDGPGFMSTTTHSLQQNPRPS